MNKKDIVDAVAARTGFDRAEAERAVEAFMSTVISSLAEGRKITVQGFGSFSVRDREERIGRNPRTGQTMTIPAARVVRFVPGKSLREGLDD
jgi:DNA-binding protein HU-beta